MLGKKPNKTLKCLTYRAGDNLKSQTLNFPLIYFTQQAVHTSLINKRCDIISNVFTVLSVIPCHKQKNLISWFDIKLTELPGYTPHHSLLLPNFSLIPSHSQFQHFSSKAPPRASCSEQQSYTNHKLPQLNNPIYQPAFHSTSRGRQALMLATGRKQFHFDTSKQNSVSAAASPMGQLPKLH